MDLAAIGERLQKARREQGLTLEACSAATKIRERYLRALEAGEADAFPADVYLRGFLRSYADYLGLDGPALVGEYAAHLEALREAADRAAGRRPTRPGRERSQPPRAPAPPAQVRPPAAGVPASRGRPGTRGVPARGGSGSGRSPLLALLLVVVVVAAGAVAWSAYRATQPAPATGDGAGGTPPETTEPPAEPETPDAATEPPPAPPPVTVSRTDPDAATIRLEVSARPLTVLLEARWGRCWVRVVADGTYLFEGTLEVGESRLVEATGEVRVVLGNPGGLSVTVNGVNLGALSELGPKTVLIVAPGS